MKLVREFTEEDYYDFQIPTWAVTAIEYGEADELSDEEWEMVRDFSREFDVVEWGDEPYFCSHPAFGLACDVLDCKCVKKGY